MVVPLVYRSSLITNSMQEKYLCGRSSMCKSKTLIYSNKMFCFFAVVLFSTKLILIIIQIEVTERDNHRFRKRRQACLQRDYSRPINNVVCTAHNHHLSSVLSRERHFISINTSFGLIHPRVYSRFCRSFFPTIWCDLPRTGQCSSNSFSRCSFPHHFIGRWIVRSLILF